MKAGEHIVTIKVYEKEEGVENTTNNGYVEYAINIKQIPTNLEIAFENKELEPGTTLNVKAILHDQTGENIPSTAIITIKITKIKF